MQNKKKSCNLGCKLDCSNKKFAAVCFEWIESGIQAIIIVVMLMSFVFRIVNVSGGSMLNTLHDNDKLIITYWGCTPHNGDIVVVKRGQKVSSPLIKRVIAVGGQKIRIDYEKGAIFIDGKQIEEPYIKERMWLKGDIDFSSEISIPKDYVFLAGDNRNNSIDSRFSDVGMIPKDYIIGKARCIIHPFNRVKLI